MTYASTSIPSSSSLIRNLFNAGYKKSRRIVGWRQAGATITNRPSCSDLFHDSIIFLAIPSSYDLTVLRLHSIHSSARRVFCCCFTRDIWKLPFPVTIHHDRAFRHGQEYFMPSSHTTSCSASISSEGFLPITRLPPTIPTLRMGTPTLLGCPSELRRSLLEHLFDGLEVHVRQQDGKVRASFGNSEDAIIYTCSQLYEEARPVLASSLRLVLHFISPNQVLKAIPSFYHSKTRTVCCHASQLSQQDLTSLSGLQRLEVDRSSSSGPSAWYLKDVNSWKLTQNATDAVVGGALDKKLKQMAKTAFLTTAETLWVKDAFCLQGRTFKIMSHISVDWSFEKRGCAYLVSKTTTV